MVLAGSRRPHRSRRRLPARTADRLASARGRDAGALRRTELARRALSYGADRAWRSAAALPLRLARRAPRRRARRAAALLGALRGRVRARRRAPRAADRRRGPGTGRDRSRLRQLDAPLPRDLRADVQPVPLDQRRLVPGLPRRGGARRWTALGALGACRAPHRRDAPLRRARPRLAGRLCTHARAHASCVCRDWLGGASGHALLVQRPRPRRTLRRRRRVRREEARRPLGGARVPVPGRGRLHRRVHAGDRGRARSGCRRRAAFCGWRIGTGPC